MYDYTGILVKTTVVPFRFFVKMDELVSFFFFMGNSRSIYFLPISKKFLGHSSKNIFLLSTWIRKHLLLKSWCSSSFSVSMVSGIVGIIMVGGILVGFLDRDMMVGFVLSLFGSKLLEVFAMFILVGEALG